ncbi:Uncharacterised protein [Klebsiella pneumoniae]|nr:Uncharacterised protein [Klebsiella pneumoniae]
MHSSKDPLHGVTLEALLNALVARYGLGGNGPPGQH